MSFGSDSNSTPPPPQLPPPPPPPEILDIVDQIAGFQETTVMSPDGRKQRVRSKLPRTPQEEELFQRAGSLISKSLKNLEELYVYDPSSVVDFKPVIDVFSQLNKERVADIAQIGNLGDVDQVVERFKAMQGDLMEREFKKQNADLNSSVNRRGWNGSTASSEMQAALASEQGLARQQADINAQIYGEQLSDYRLSRNERMYNAREQVRQSQLAEAQQEYTLKQQNLQDLEGKRQRAIADNEKLLSLGSAIQGQDVSKVALSRLPELSNSILQTQTAGNIASYNADITRQSMQHQMNTQHQANKPPSFGNFLGQSALTLGGHYLKGGASPSAVFSSAPRKGGYKLTPEGNSTW